MNTFGVDLEYSNVTHPLPFLTWHGAEANQRQQGVKKQHRLEGTYGLFVFCCFKVNLFCLDGKWGSDVKLRWISEIINIGTDIVVHIVGG